jgi:hypothetical protein
MRKRTSRIPAVIVAALILAAASLFGAIGASADGGHGHDGDNNQQQGDRRHGDDNGGSIFRSTLAPSVPADPALHGVAAGGAPWVLSRGDVRIDAKGRVRVRIAGLVIPVAHGTFPAGTARPVTVVSAALYCGADTTAAATTPSVPISETGDGSISAQVTLPATCLAPVVLIHPNDVAGAYIAASGWRS